MILAETGGNPVDLWTEFLGLVSQIVTPVWNSIIQYIPLLFLFLIPLVLYGLAALWLRHRNANKPRIPRRLPDGRTPEGLHLPSPSMWPIVGAVGMFLIFFSLVIGGKSGPNLLILPLGLLIGFVALAGWYFDAKKEYVAVEAGDHHLVPVAETAGHHAEQTIPEGIHLPAPSPWPFLAPIGLFFAFLGLAVGPVLIAGGLAMAAIAAIGWYFDAGREYREVESGHHDTDPAHRDPERIFPKKLMPFYAGIAFAAILLTAGPWLLTFLPQKGPDAEGPTPTTTPVVSAQSAAGFDQRGIYVPAETDFTITFNNNNPGVPHNIEIFTDISTTDQYFLGDTITGVSTIEYKVPALEAGQYRFICSIHPNMQGTVFVQ
ncbi:MAG: cupredoxin domain-containing protein [Chloroflexota bacterium]